MVHGRLKPAERDAEMTRFRDGDLDVLVGTTVVEVGVDVPAATMMVIEGADRFGLAQLHQLRGRVGRGSVESFCVLVSESTDETAIGAPACGRRVRTTASPWPRRTSSCARRATSSGSPRAASRASGSRRSRSPSIASWPSGRVSTPRPCSTTTAASTRATRPSPRSWRAAGSDGSRPRNRRAAHDAGERHAWLTPAGSSPGRPGASGSRRRAPGRGRSATASSRRCSRSSSRTCAGARVLDLFAGSGAAGIEALSRGAASAVFVERDAGACAVIKANLERARLAGRAPRVVRADALAWLASPAAAEAAPFDLVIADPPYDDTAALRPDASSASDPLLAPGARVVAKHFWRDPPPATVGLLASERERRFGETALTFYRRQEAR